MQTAQERCDEDCLQDQHDGRCGCAVEKEAGIGAQQHRSCADSDRYDQHRPEAVIPIRKNGRRWKEDCPAARARNDILRATHRLGRAIWKHWSGYHARSRIEARMQCLKAFGERIASRGPDRQTAEIQIRIALMNRFNSLGTAEIERVA